MDTQKQGKLQFRIDLVLTVLFLLVIFYFLLGSVFLDDGLLGHAFYMKYLSDYLEDPDDYTAWELVEASIHSLDNYIASNIHGTDALGKVNSSFQYALGKRLVSTGGTQMIRLKTGHLYDMVSAKSMEPARQDIVNMREIVTEDIPFLFVYEHSTLYDEEAQMPEGYEVLDHSAQEADEILDLLSKSGIDVMDSREILMSTGLPLDELLMYTDQHWSTRAAIIMAQSISERVEEMTGIDMASERLDIDQFETKVYPKLFLGKYGQRIGTGNIDPDDIITYSPKYETHLTSQCNALSGYSEREGSFDEVNLNQRSLVPDEGKTWNIRAYTDYGLSEKYEILRNEDGADVSILLLKDSFAAPIGRFLSLVAGQVYSVDLRSNPDVTLKEWVEQSRPDIVIVAFSSRMLRKEQYDFFY